jgi:hypothetical protein
MGGKKEKRGALVVAGMARFVFRVWRLFAHSHVRHQSSLAVSRWLMKQLAASTAGHVLWLWREPSTKKPNSQINVGGVNGRNTRPWPLSVLKIVEV